jgi:hypothetical protein
MAGGAGDDSAVWYRSSLSRRDLLRHTTGVTLGLGVRSATEQQARAQADSDSPGDAFAGVALPPDLGQTDLQVYVEATGHTLRGSMLDYWRANGAAAIYGNPISEPFAAANGYYSQAFERGIFQYRPEYLYTADPIMRLMPLGRLALQDRVGIFRFGRRLGEGDRQLDFWRKRDATEEAVAHVLGQGGIFVDATGHTISGPILAWYDFNEGAFYLGSPLSEPLSESADTVQWFEGGLLQSSDDAVALAPLASQMATRLGIETTTGRRGDLPLYDELLFWTADNPNPLGDPYAPGAKWVEVSIAQQRLWAYQGNTLISSTLVSTGLDPNPTEIGMFHVRLKYPQQDMKGFTNATGEVVGPGDAPPDAIPYDVKDIPNVMYFDMQGEALHGAYWHNNFGQKMSHGCVNLPLDFAAWLYGWAPLGTGVWVHD